MPTDSHPVAITGTGLFTPPFAISNEELVDSFNRYVEREMQRFPDLELLTSSADFIVKASGIKSRFVMDKAGILDIDRMCPSGLERGPEEVSLLAEMAVIAANQALSSAQKAPKDVGAVIIACSNLPRPYPALAVEVQKELQIEGFAYDMNVACASAVFGIHAAVNQLRLHPKKGVLVISPEICTGHLNFTDRDSHFIFGDAATAVFLETKTECKSDHAYEILSVRLATQFSNNIRNSFGFLNRTSPQTLSDDQRLFKQNGRKVFKEVIQLVSQHLKDHLEEEKIAASDLSRLWLHQANQSMNQLITKNLLGSEADNERAPIILDTYANTSSAGSIIAFHLNNQDLRPKDLGLISAFGAGYSMGSVLIKKI